MRNKFSEWVEQGIAKFDYTPILPEMHHKDPICLEYNNIFSMALDTHMSLLEDGRRIITGHNVGTDKWNYFMNCSHWGGINFCENHNYFTLRGFLQNNNLVDTYGLINGDYVCILQDANTLQSETSIATESLLNESMPVIYVVNIKNNKSYLIASKNEEEAIKMVPDTDKDNLKAVSIKGLSIKDKSNTVIFMDSDMVINRK